MDKQSACRCTKNDYLKGSCVYPKETFINKDFAKTFSCVKCDGVPRNCMSDKNGEILCCGCSEDNCEPVIALQKLIEDLDIQCSSSFIISSYESYELYELYGANDNDQCKWKEKVKDFEKHSHECLYMIIECNACEMHICKRKDIDKHLEQCPDVLIYCPNQCGEKLERRWVENHTKTECPESIVDCPNHECKMQISRKDIDAHTKNECEERIVFCKYKQYGCLANVKARDLNHHMDTSKDMHLSVVTSNLNEKIEQQQKIIDEQQLQLNQIQDFLKGVKK
eukprot:393568_1